MTDQPASRREVYGPYATEREAIVDSRDITSLPPGVGEWDRAIVRKVHETCAAAGVELGDYDERIVSWMSRWEPQAVQAVIGIISRAGAR